MTEALEGVENDIPLSTARSAHQGTSFDPDKRGLQELEMYKTALQLVWDRWIGQADTQGKKEFLMKEFAEYRKRYRKAFLAHLHARSCCISTMITGGSNFPVRRAEKANDTAHRRLTELLAVSERFTKKMEGFFNPGERAIMSGDSDAVDRLQEKVAELTALQERMKAVNKAHKAYLKNPESLLNSGLSEADRNLVIRYRPEHSWEPHPFAPYRLTNNLKTLRNAEARLKQIQSQKSQPVVEQESGGIRLEINPEEHRVRLYFPGKPDAETRTRLKGSGFRWTPSLGCWQAYNSSRAQEVARSFLQQGAES